MRDPSFTRSTNDGSFLIAFVAALKVAQKQMRNQNEVMNELRRKRKELGITQAQAANACGVSRRTYQTYEETDAQNETYDELVRTLEEISSPTSDRFITSPRCIRHVCQELFSAKYPEIKCAYLFGSYARKEATGTSDVDIMVVCEPMGMKFYGIGPELEELLNRRVDLITHRQIMVNEELLKDILIEGIKIYG